MQQQIYRGLLMLHENFISMGTVLSVAPLGSYLSCETCNFFIDFLLVSSSTSGNITHMVVQKARLPVKRPHCICAAHSPPFVPEKGGEELNDIIVQDFLGFRY